MTAQHTSCRIAVALSFLLLMPNQVFAQTPQNVEALNFIKTNAAVELKRGEFETTVDYKNRLHSLPSAALTITASTLQSGAADKKTFSYDADAQTLTIRLLGNSAIEPIRIFDSSSDEGKKFIGVRGQYAKFIFLKSDPRVVKEYQGQNSYGAQTKITETTWDERSVAIGNVPVGYGASTVETKIQVDAITAQKIVKSAQWRLEVQPTILPGQVKYILDDGLYIKPTVSSPSEVWVNGKTFMATLLKAEVVDLENGVVYATFLPKGTQAPLKFGVQFSMPKQTDSTTGLVILAVTADSVAAKSGLLPNDVLLQFGTQALKALADMPKAIAEIQAGKLIELQILRDGVRKVLTAQF